MACVRSTDNMYLIACRVNWGRSSALKSRWEEEVALVEEEMKDVPKDDDM